MFEVHDLSHSYLFLSNLVLLIELGQPIAINMTFGKLAMEEPAPLIESLVGPFDQRLVLCKEVDMILIELIPGIRHMGHWLLLESTSSIRVLLGG